ncbi:hypothetical protein ROJ8625_00926 [Roseivivax jejudonensis]|uniref:Uncharacterized protein n=1 Tax=Roseivivax jejudonensis TaxID=1529041 RepID=A0A1X6YLJ7_9RHOB|nr:hypothetical protein [Roseivivax jejudonensis]SLN23215.1 hypothetical protein ROJ8625_00926 [Roseivivax jejudonensis]
MSLEQDPDANVLYYIAELYREISAKDAKEKLNQAFTGLIEELPPIDAKLRILSLFDDAIHLVSHLSIREDRIRRRLEFIQEAKGRFLTACSKETVDEFKKTSRAQATADLLESSGDAVSEAKLDFTQPLDRSGFLATTDELIEFVSNSGLPSLQRKVMILELNALSRTMRECHDATDDQIRRRVKCIYADFCSEFVVLDRQHEDVLDAVTRWAKGAMKVGIFALALAADTTSLAGYISGPDGPRALPKPDDN